MRPLSLVLLAFPFSVTVALALGCYAQEARLPSSGFEQRTRTCWEAGFRHLNRDALKNSQEAWIFDSEVKIFAEHKGTHVFYFCKANFQR